ncbi:hypothetical protein QQS21_009212 [Conoideocrella luteorostrata]|uniref:Xylanolytic transcriptional activator regulatory domain-containing protein n=1 Tax=Conoideocrella luteorostrata TaxID=1105319 RepID=A0AAJ0FQM0_9HYPO|nr:hypothetical protein QQS21_009212 [Conoideocrella luteorostrata]
MYQPQPVEEASLGTTTSGESSHSPAYPSPAPPFPSQTPHQVYLACPECRSDHVSGFSRKSHRVAPLGQIYFAGQKFGAVCPRNGIPHLTSYCEQWIFERTGQKPRFREMFVGYAINKDSSNSQQVEQQLSLPVAQNQPKAHCLPEKWILESLTAEFLAADFSLVFPLINPLLFEETTRIAYGEDAEEPTLERITAKACVLALVSLLSYHFPLHDASSRIDGDACANAAQNMVADILEDASVTTLQTLLILLLHDTLCGRLQASVMYHALACRVVFALGGHATTVSVPRDRDLTLQEHEDGHLRTLFWLCYVLDKDIALRTGQPPIINDQFCDLTLPDGYVQDRFIGRQRNRKSGRLQNPWLPGDLKLSMIKSKAVTSLYSTPSLRMSDAELLKTIRELDEELESWRTSIPEEFSPSLSIRRDVRLAQHESVSQGMLLIELHLDYHFLLNTIHCASGRCMNWEASSTQQLSFGVQSSFDLSVQASRATMIYLSASADRVAGEAFWFFIFYPLSAVMVLFFNILQNPDHLLATHDMELLSKASHIIRSMPIRRVTSHEKEYLVKMDKLVAELSRLSKCAVDRHYAHLSMQE